MSNRKILLGLSPLVLVIAAGGCTDDYRLPDPPKYDAGTGSSGGTRFPDTTIEAMPAAATNEGVVTFRFRSDQPGAEFRCTLDRFLVLRVPCTSPYTVTIESDGSHTFEVEAVVDYDRDPTPASYTWTLDRVAPRGTMIAGPSGVDNSTAPVISFVAEEGTTTTCALDERLPVSCTSPFHAPTLAEGPHRFRVVATDAAGNVELSPPTTSWVIDATTSDTVIDSGPIGVVASRHQVFTFSSPDATPGSTFRCTLDGQSLGACSSPREVDVGIDGNHTFTVQVVEANGNRDPSPASRSWVVDSVPPAIAITSAPAPITSDPTPTFTFAADGTAVAVECRFGAAAFAPCASPFTAEPLPDGATTFEVRARDAIGNTGSATRSVTIDTAAPVLTITAAPANPSNDATPTFEFTAPDATVKCQIVGFTAFACTSPHTFSPGSGSFTFRFIATDAAGNATTVDRALTIDVSAPTLSLDGPPARTANPTPTFTFASEASATLTCSLDGAPFTACASPLTLAPVALGDHRFIVRARDTAGNQASAFRDFFDDPRPLSLAITSGPTGTINDRRPQLTWTQTGATIEGCRYDASPFTTCSAALATDLADGPHTFEVKVVNDLGGQLAATRSFTVDTVAPLATITAGPTGTITTPIAAFEFTTSGAPTVTECRLLPGGLGTGPYAPCGSPATFELTTAGAYTFEVRVRDQAGNQWSAYREFTFAP